jgi:hypothetical protein
MSFPMSNTKIFNNLQDLCSYCEKCLICGKNREISWSFGPDDVCSIIGSSFSYNNEYTKKNKLYINFDIYLNLKKERSRLSFRISASDNTFEFDIHPVRELSDEEDAVYSSSSPYLYFYLNSTCRECNSHTTSTEDIEIDLNNNLIKNLNLEKETVYLSEDGKNFEFDIDYIKQSVDIVNYSKNSSKRGVKIENVPFIDYDFSDRKRLLKKIQTIITFG